MNTTDSKVLDLLKKMADARADNYYSRYINQCRKDECLGADAKMASGNFKRDELEAHKEASRLLGQHQVYVELQAFVAANLKSTENEHGG